MIFSLSQSKGWWVHCVHINNEWIEESTLQIWSKPCRVGHLLEVMVANKVVKVVVVADVEEATTTSTIKMEMVTNSSKGMGNTSKPNDKPHLQCFRCKKYKHYKSKYWIKL